MSLGESRSLLLEFMAGSGVSLETHEIFMEKEVPEIGWYFMLNTKSDTDTVLDGSLYNYLVNPHRKEVVNLMGGFTVKLYEIWLKGKPARNSLSEFYNFAHEFRKKLYNNRIIYNEYVKSVQNVERKRNKIVVKRYGRILHEISLKKIKIIGRLDIYYPEYPLIDMQVVFVENESKIKLFSSFSNGSDEVLDSLCEYFPGFLPNWMDERNLENFSMALWWPNCLNEDYGKSFELFEKFDLSPDEEGIFGNFSTSILEPELDLYLSKEALKRIRN